VSGNSEKDQRKVGKRKVTLEIIGVLGALFGFLVYGMVKTQLARRQVEAKQEAEKAAPVVAERASIASGQERS
jgi:Na+-translocating ferredoxin:NAD+ oxidoreductase RnfG subunit